MAVAIFCGSILAVTSPAAVVGRAPPWVAVAQQNAVRMPTYAEYVGHALSLSLCHSLPVFSVCLPVSPTSLSRRSALRRPQLDAMAIRGENQSSYSLKLELSLRMCNGSYNRISETINRLYKRETRVHHTGRGLLTRSANESKRSERGTNLVCAWGKSSCFFQVDNALRDPFAIREKINHHIHSS